MRFTYCILIAATTSLPTFKLIESVVKAGHDRILASDFHSTETQANQKNTPTATKVPKAAPSNDNSPMSPSRTRGNSSQPTTTANPPKSMGNRPEAKPTPTPKPTSIPKPAQTMSAGSTAKPPPKPTNNEQGTTARENGELPLIPGTLGLNLR